MVSSQTMTFVNKGKGYRDGMGVAYVSDLDWTQGLTHEKQVVHHTAISLTPYSVIFPGHGLAFLKYYVLLGVRTTF